MRQLLRWLAYGAIVLALPAAGWKLVQTGSSGLVENERSRLQNDVVMRWPGLAVPESKLPTARAGDREGPGADGRWAQAVGNQRVEQPAIIGEMTASDLQVMKESYSCDLARTARRDCDTAYENPSTHEMCLSLRQYYTYSRHCGYQP